MDMVFVVTSLNQTTEHAMSHLSHPPLLAVTRVQHSTQNVETNARVEVRFSGTRYATEIAFIVNQSTFTRDSNVIRNLT